MNNTERSASAEVLVTPDAAVSRVSWAAVFAGVVLAVMVMGILNMLALGIGISSIDIRGTGDSAEGVGTGLGWAMVIINLVAYAVGGYTAGRLAGPGRSGLGFVHGLLSWAVLVLGSMLLLASAAGAVLGSIGSVLSTGIEAAAQGAGALAPAVSESVDNATSGLGDATTSVREQLSDLLRESADTDDADSGLAAIRPDELVRDVFSDDDELFSEQNRSDIEELLVEETDLSRAEAQEVVSSWEDRYREAQEKLDEAQAELERTAEEAKAAISRTMLWGAIALLVMGAIAGWAGSSGAGARTYGPVRRDRLA